jgi:hypothetical protein
MNLYNDETNQKNINTTMNIHVDCPNIQSGQDFIKSLKELPQLVMQSINKGNN